MSLKQYINRQNKTLGEVELFDEMIGYFDNQPFATVVQTDRTHHHLVDYTPLPPYNTLWGNNVTKEISDVFFLVFSRKRRMARMTHLQAKLTSKIWPVHDNKHTFSFTLDVGQYHMLHNRLQINDLKGMYPRDILSFPLYSDSVSSYGVFYKSSDTNMYDMAFEIASLVSYSKSKPYKSADSQLVHSFATANDMWGYMNIKYPQAMPILRHILHCCDICWECCCEHMPELLSTVSVETFERELLELRVGTRVDFDITTLQQIAQLFNRNKAFSDFINEMTTRLERRMWIEFIENFRRDQNGNEPPRENLQDINPKEMGGAYILINADEVEREQ